MTINVDTESLIRIKNNVMKETDDLEYNINNLVHEINNLGTVWKSQSAESYISLMVEKVIEDLKRIKDSTIDYADNLEIVAKTYDKLDEIFKNKKIEV